MQILTHFISIGQYLHQAEIPNYVNNVARQLRQFEKMTLFLVNSIGTFSQKEKGKTQISIYPNKLYRFRVASRHHMGHQNEL